MKRVGIRELKDRLSEYVRCARRGETVLVTDRGQVVAEIAPPGRASRHPGLPEGLLDMAERGLATLGAPGAAERYVALEPILRGTSSADLLRAEREAR
jgi:antitoxin (DNA-binding transcriptional repressor) of toxin-antitoxin stability system